MSTPAKPSAVEQPRFPPPPAWSQGLRTVGVTGTNGKTSTTALIASALRELGGPVPRVTTVGAYLDEQPMPVPPSHEGFLAVMRAGHQRGARFAAIEVTSEALFLGFAKAWPCHIGVFTNLTRDHLDAHGSAEHYLASKAQLFLHLPPAGVAVLNGCDPASELLAEVVPSGATVLRYGAPNRGDALAPLDLQAEEVELSWAGTRVRLVASQQWLSPGVADQPFELELQTIGHVFAENAVAAYAAAVAAGVPPADAARGIARSPRPPGRFEVVHERPHVVVDYAHTPDSLQRTLQSARALCAGRLWVVFGAGGDRDQSKRPQMGEAANGADRIVLTSDNPRSEDATDIAAAIRQGIGPLPDVAVEVDRATAIRDAVRGAAADDVVVIAGKGHETEQLAANGRRSFSDQQVVQQLVQRSGEG